MFACLSVSETTLESYGDFHDIWEIAKLWTKVVRDIFWYKSVLKIATPRLLRVERGQCAGPRLYWYNDRHTVKLLHLHAHLLASNDTVPISMWHNEGMRCCECPLLILPAVIRATDLFVAQIYVTITHNKRVYQLYLTNSASTKQWGKPRLTILRTDNQPRFGLVTWFSCYGRPM